MKQTIEIEVPEGYKAVYDKDTQQIEIVRIEPPKTWEDFCKKYPVKKGEYFIGKFSDILCVKEDHERNCVFDRNILPNKKTAESVLTLMQLIQLRDYYRQGWEPDYMDDKTHKYTISLFNNEICREQFDFFNHVLSFQSEQIRDEFVDNFKDLIEKGLCDEDKNTNISDGLYKTMTWEKFCLDNHINKGECYINIVSDINYASTGTARCRNVDKNILPDKKTAESFLALMQLVQLRDCYRQGWKPDWKDSNQQKFSVITCYDVLYPDTFIATKSILSFQTAEIRDEFLKNFKDLIEKAKELI